MSENFKKPRMIQYLTHDQSRYYGLLPVKAPILNDFPSHEHDFYEFELVVEGRLVHTAYGRREELCPGDFHCLSPDTVHSLKKSTNTVLVYNLSVLPEDASPEIRALVEGMRYPSSGHLEGEELSLFRTLFDVLFHDSHNAVLHEKEKASAIAVYLLTLLSEHATERRELMPRAGREGYLRKAIDIIRAEYARDLRLSEVAAAVAVSPCYLSGLFSSQLGMTFKEQLTATRLRRATNLLLTTDSPITEVAFLCGFGSFSSFERAFSAFLGMTPREYRRSVCRGAD